MGEKRREKDKEGYGGEQLGKLSCRCLSTESNCMCTDRLGPCYFITINITESHNILILSAHAWQSLVCVSLSAAFLPLQASGQPMIYSNSFRTAIAMSLK